MKTPICDFAQDYAARSPVRLHTPGHKGQGFLGFETLDITEFSGADDLYSPTGIIRESEENASALFGCPTVYSTEGSSQCIRAMVYLAMITAKKQGKIPRIAAARNAHRTFLTAVALLDIETLWLYPRQAEGYLSCNITAEDLESVFATDAPPTAVYVTSPDYLGQMADIPSLAEVCHRHGALRLVDGAHGAYLRFLPQSRFFIDLGADLCCSSGHKTLPVLTGGAYLHISETLYAGLSHQVKPAMALFGSTSPSYLILQSLDAANGYLANCRPEIAEFTRSVADLKEALSGHGYKLIGHEPWKVTIDAKVYGYTGEEMAMHLENCGIISEFFDPDYLVLMLSPQVGQAGLIKLEASLLALAKKAPAPTTPPALKKAVCVCSPREASLSPSRQVPVEESLGKVLADPGIGCPPAVPILVCGEQIDAHALEVFRYYGIEKVSIID